MSAAFLVIGQNLRDYTPSLDLKITLAIFERSGQQLVASRDWSRRFLWVELGKPNIGSNEKSGY